MKKEDILLIGENIKLCKASVKNTESLEQFKSEILGKKGKLTLLLRELKDLTGEEKTEFGKALNKIKTDFEEYCAIKLKEFNSSEIEKSILSSNDDLTLPGEYFREGSLHPLSQIIRRITEIFSKMGYVCADGPEAETDFYNFEALNFPDEHPARDMHDTFYLDMKDGKKNFILRTHTSPVQIRAMKTHQPPIRILIPGRVFRHEATDATHSFVFHQVEGLVVSENITFADLKGHLNMFAHEMFGADLKTRFRPSFFPFTEPSAEMDIQCIFCGGKGCRMCKSSGWLEIMGSGMVHPNVLTAGGYDPQKVTGFAFGMGVERIALLKYGVNDMRLFYENDIRFLRQF